MGSLLTEYAHYQQQPSVVAFLVRIEHCYCSTVELVIGPFMCCPSEGLSRLLSKLLSTMLCANSILRLSFVLFEDFLQ